MCCILFIKSISGISMQKMVCKKKSGSHTSVIYLDTVPCNSCLVFDVDTRKSRCCMYYYF